MLYKSIQVHIIFKSFSQFTSHIYSHFNQCSIAAIVLNIITFICYKDTYGIGHCTVNAIHRTCNNYKNVMLKSTHKSHVDRIPYLTYNRDTIIQQQTSNCMEIDFINLQLSCKICDVGTYSQIIYITLYYEQCKIDQQDMRVEVRLSIN